MRSVQPPSLGYRAACLVALLVLAAGNLGAQTVSPGSITLDPTATCGGGSETVDEVCITLPDQATCSTVDLFLLFDDTGSFSRHTANTAAVFDDIVDDLGVLGIDLAVGVGRFEDYGGPGADFGAVLPANRPFVLNQAVLSATSPGFDAALQAALDTAGSGPGGGGDDPESALEALYQAATGGGFNGNPDTNASVLDSGPAGDPSTWQTPGASGDVPDFASYVPAKQKSGELGGAGWRAESCLRLVVLATDVCSVAAFAPGAAIPASIVSSGSTEPASAFSCAGGTRFGFVSDAESKAKSTVANAVAPVGAATVPEVVEALNDLGIRVIGLGPGAAPTASTLPSNQPSTFLSALARLTGAVDVGGDPLVFDLGSGSADIRDAIVDAVTTSAQAPVDVALVPAPPLPGLTVTADPAVQTVGPGETACFSVSFDGDDSFQGGSLGLDFVNVASNGSLGMKVPVSLKCPDCFDLIPRRLLCIADDGGFTGSYEWTFVIRNRSKDVIHHLFFVDLPAGVTVEPQHLVFSPPLQPNQPRLVTVKIHGAAPGTSLNLRITLHDAEFGECCAEEVRLELPACDCAQLRKSDVEGCFGFPFGSAGPPYTYTFDLENLAPPPAVDYLLLAPVSPADHSHPVSPSQVVIAPNVIALSSPLGTGEATGNRTVEISGPAAKPGEQVCFRISTHDTGFNECCSIVKCVTIPDCSIGPIDFEPKGGATLTRSGSSLIVSDIGSGGGDGVAASFAPSGDAGVSLQDFSAGVPIPKGAFVRFAARGLDAAGEEREVANVIATRVGRRVRVFPGRGAPSLGEVLVLREGEVVASCEESAVVVALDRDWPTSFVMEDNLIGIVDPASQPASRDLITIDNLSGVTWSGPVRLRVPACGTFEGDRALFVHEGLRSVEALTGAELTAADIPALVIKSFDLDPVVLPDP